MRLSARGVRLITEFEGFRSHPYRDPVGIWTIGFGSTKGVGPRTRPISRAGAEARLREEVDATYGAAVNRALRESRSSDWNQNEFDALTSFAYNLGPASVTDTRSWTMARAIRAGDKRRIADAFLLYDKAGGRRLAGLTRRRRAERSLFLAPDRWDDYREDELRWIREYDSKPRLARRLVLRRYMARRARQIRRAANAKGPGGGWTDSRRRRVRSLEARS